MSDPSFELVDPLILALKADAGLAAAFPLGKARVFDLPPPSQAMPYVCFDEAQVESQAAQGFDGSETNLSLHVWTRTDPTGMRQCKALAATLVDAVTRADIVLPSFRLVQVRWIDSRYLLQPDGQTVHGVVRFALSADPN